MNTPKRKRGTGRPTSYPASTPGLPPIKRKGHAIVRVPMDEDGNLLYGALVESKLRDILEDSEILDGEVLMAKFGLRRVMRVVEDEVTGETRFEEEFENISAREQQGAIQFLLSRALPSIAMTGRLPGGVKTPGDEQKASPEAATLIQQYS